MKLPKELVEQWWGDWMGSLVGLTQAEYIAQRAYDYALEEAARVCEETHERMNSSFQGAANEIRKLKEVQS